ncbi:MAG TPA: NPCBM/NEW2 domain-containing protein [Pirellulales bacterium]|nr:NPCBM/NEW2 domain-containing protein [Pirellulales bacterium]
MPDAFNPYHKWLGIPPDEQPADHYRLLAIARFESDADVISGAADRQMGHLRTFQTGQRSALSQKLLNELSAARLCLLSPERKAAYDDQLRRQFAAVQRPRPAVAAPIRLAGAPAYAPAPTQVRTEAPALIVTDDGPPHRSMRKRRSGVGRSASSWLALAFVAVLAACFVGYLIWTKPEAESIAKAPGRAEIQPAKALQTQPPATKRSTDSDSTGSREGAPEAEDRSITKPRPQPQGVAKREALLSEEKQLAGQTGSPRHPGASSPSAADAARPAAEIVQPSEATQSVGPPTQGRSLADLTETEDEESPGAGKSPDAPGSGRSKASRADRRRKGPASGTTTFLCELPLQAWFVFVPRKGAVTVLTPGLRFDDGGALRVDNRPAPHGIFAPPPDNSFSSLSFQLGKRAKSLSLEVGLDDGSGPFLATQPVFQVWGDNKLLWTSAAIRGRGHTDKCENLSIEGVKLLVLRVNCPGKRDGTGAVWFEPAVTWK